MVHATASNFPFLFTFTYRPSSVVFLFFFFALRIAPSDCLTLYMGLLKVGIPKTWDDSKKDLTYIRNAGMRQFLSTFRRVKDLKGDELLWGDEIEYGIFHLDPQSKKVRLSLRAKQIMDQLNEKESQHSQVVEGCNWVPEYGAWMVEATPDRPYTGYTTDLLRVERNMRLRRKRLLTVLQENEVAPTITAYFMLGAQGDDGTVPQTSVGGPITESQYIGDAIINPHPRFGTLTANIRQRRGEKVSIQVPLFRDLNTPEYQNFNVPLMHGDTDGCCGSDSLQVWRYGRNCRAREQYGKEFVLTGCSDQEELFWKKEEEGYLLQKWLVDVQCVGCKGLFYRRAPGEIVADADWPRNGEVVLGYELQDPPNWIRLQNGYYLPLKSDDGKIQFLHKITARTVSAMENGSSSKESIGSKTPLFRNAPNIAAASLMDGKVTLGTAVVQTTRGAVATASDTAVPTTVNTIPLVPATSDAKSPAPTETLRAAIHMDAMAFGMGNCCLQITFQAQDIDESRYIYDQLAVLAPILMALTAATPILRGRLADTDARWGVISESVDDRTPAERGRPDPQAPHEALSANGQRRIYKSRYDSISTYIYQGGPCKDDRRVRNSYNDIPVPVDGDCYQMLLENGVDAALAQHVSHLFIRDPLVVFDGAVQEVDDETQTEHWESIQSTNWQTVRWKPPPPRNSPNDPHIGWRTEFRSMELQLTDFENAAFTAFIVLLTRVILTFDLNLYIPLSRVDANMQRAHSRNAAAKGKFFFRRHLAPLEEGDDGYGVKYVSMFSSALNGSADFYDNEDGLVTSSTEAHMTAVVGKEVSQREAAPCALGSSEEHSYEEMSMAEIMCGKGDYFPGLIPLVHAYLDHISCDKVTRERLDKYLDFLERRAKGELVTPATWMRTFVRNHPQYQRDSVVTDEIAYDLMVACRDIGLGKLHVPELLGPYEIEPVTTEGAYDVPLQTTRVRNRQLLGLLRRYTSRQSFARSKGENASGDE